MYIFIYIYIYIKIYIYIYKIYVCRLGWDSVVPLVMCTDFRLTFCILSKRFPITLLVVDSRSFLVQCSSYRVGLSFLSCPPIQYFVLQNEVEMTSNFPCVISNRCFLLHKHVGLCMVVMDSVFPFVV